MRTQEVVQVDAVVTEPLDDVDGVTLALDHPACRPESRVYDYVFADAPALKRGDHVTMLVHPDDPEVYVIEEGEPLSPTFGMVAGIVAAGCAIAGAGSALMARRRYRATYGSPAPRQEPRSST